LPNIVEGNQQTAQIMSHDVLTEDLPIKDGPFWGVPRGSGLGIEINDQLVADAALRYERDGPFLPYQSP
jgi:L-alanine-DL-glutamate epimerase-like enolase superfamily enzyme